LHFGALVPSRRLPALATRLEEILDPVNESNLPEFAPVQIFFL
jgi:hypothetical protein